MHPTSHDDKCENELHDYPKNLDWIWFGLECFLTLRDWTQGSILLTLLGDGWDNVMRRISSWKVLRGPASLAYIITFCWFPPLSLPVPPKKHFHETESKITVVVRGDQLTMLMTFVNDAAENYVTYVLSTLLSHYLQEAILVSSSGSRTYRKRTCLFLSKHWKRIVCDVSRELSRPASMQTTSSVKSLQ